MNEYDFSRLNDKEFEVFCTDLLSAREGVRFERFKPGRDSGVDGRYFKSDGNEWVLQCKHWVATPLEKLVKNIEDTEYLKVKKLSPARYILVLSHPLSRNDKTILMQKLAPFVLTPDDILGREDLNDLLAKYPDVERRHYKLWISSSNVLRYLLSKPIHDRSDFAFNEIVEDAKLYVPTANHADAIDKLESMNVVIITGPAGIGKTTLAGQLILHYVSQDFTLAVVADDIKEAEGVYDQEARQIFYFDDFLGRNYLEALSGHEGGQIVNFIKRIVKDPNKRFVLTSRTTILNQGKILNDVFENQNIARNEFEVTLSSMKVMDKARILYNHIWHSELEGDYVDELYAQKRYRDLIDHPNFNPRLIRFITDVQRLEGVAPKLYWSHAINLLNNPSQVWDNPYQAQLDDCGRAMVLLVTMNGRQIAEVDLAEAFARYLGAPGLGSLTGKKDFLLNLRHLSGSMLTRFIVGDTQPFIRLFNPSLGDFVLNRYATNKPALRICFSSLQTLSSLNTLKDMVANKIIPASTAVDVADYIFRCICELRFLSCESEFVARLCMMRTELGLVFSTSDQSFLDAIEFIISSDCAGLFLSSANVVLWALENECVGMGPVERFLETACSSNPSYDELLVLGEIISHFGASEYEALTVTYDEAVTTYLIESVEDEFPESAVFNDCSSESQARRNFRELMEEQAGQLGATDLSAVVDSVEESINVEKHYDTYFYGGEPEPDYEYRRDQRMIWPGPLRDEVDPVDDLFSRD
ncbi:restriction endonuclease [Pseudomonas sp. K5]|uniref:nSTAND3 domain-containing NTPase n=1 Tax=Pseudomonas sp. K5 TaxID=1156313 RepID=UPI0018690F28|nr:restriction endonuclease [Pseudomonas sp. K5]